MSKMHRIRLSQTNCYLLQAKGSFLLIDCGNAHDKQTFLNSLRALGIAITEIRYLFITHHHNDHTGLINDLVSLNPDITVILSEKCAAYLKTGRHHNHPTQRYASPLLRLIVGMFTKLNKGFSEFTNYVTRSQDIVVQEDNDTFFPELGIPGRILFTPGHTEDSISLVVGEIAFVGDAARNSLNILGAPYHPFILNDLESCYASWSILIAAGAKTICPAHGKPFEVKPIMNIKSR